MERTSLKSVILRPRAARETSSISVRLSSVGFIVPHLLVDGLVLHPVRGDAGALLANVQNDSREGATVDAAPAADGTERAQCRHFSEG